MQLLQKINEWFLNQNIRNKLFVLITVMTLFLIFVGVVGFYISYKENQRLYFQYRGRLQSVKLLNSMRANLRDNESNIYILLLTSDPVLRKQTIASINKRNSLWSKELKDYSSQALHDPYEVKALPLLQKKSSKYNYIEDKTILLAIAGKKQEAINYYFPNMHLLNDLTNMMIDLSDYNSKMAKKEYEKSIIIARISNLIILGSILLSLGFSISLLFLITNSMVKSVKILVEKMKQVAAGNLEIEPIKVKYKNEIGSLNNSFNIMTDNLRRKTLAEKVLKEREELLRQKVEEQRKIFWATLTHDLRSPLIAEQKAIEAILSQSLGTSLENFSMYLEEMYRTNEELLRIVNNLLMTYHYESGKIELALEQSNMEDIIKNSIKSMKPLAMDNDSEIIIDIQPGLPSVMANRDEINRVITNLISNAIKHNIKGTNIKVTAKKTDNEIQVSISDNGKGIPETERVNIFQKYPTTKRKIGTGLGLYLSKQIIDSHNGNIWFDTEVGKGTTFYFTLPIA